MINNNINNISSSIQIGRNDDMQLSLNNDNIEVGEFTVQNTCLGQYEDKGLLHTI